MPDSRIKSVMFADAAILGAFERLKDGKHEEKELYSQIDEIMKELGKNPDYGIRLPRKIWPKFYIRKYGVNNLWKCDLPQGWRLVYTVRGNSIEVVSIILEWFDHAAYERRFGYAER